MKAEQGYDEAQSSNAQSRDTWDATDHALLNSTARKPMSMNFLLWSSNMPLDLVCR